VSLTDVHMRHQNNNTFYQICVKSENPRIKIAGRCCGIKEKCSGVFR